MAEISQKDWLDAIEDAAMRAADARVEYNRAIGAMKNTDAEQAASLYFDDYVKRLKKLVPFDGVKGSDLDELYGFKGDSMMKWVDGNFNGPSPKETAKQVEASKFLPLLQGVAKQGDDWMSMGSDRLKGAAVELGYKPGTQEGFKKFLDKLGEYQQEYDRSKLVKEMQADPAYIPTALFYPKLVEGIENAVATGSDLSKEDAVKLGALDAGMNATIFMAPSATILKSRPLLNGAIDAGIQGGAELIRQYGAQAIDPSLTPDGTQAKIAAVAGATRPVLIGAAHGIAAQATGQPAQQFSRGVMKATRAGNPVWQERDNVFNLVNEYNKRMLKGELKAGQEVSFMNLGDARRFASMNKVPQMAQELGIKANKNGTYSAKDILKAYDKKPIVAMQVTDKGVQKVDATPFSVGENEFVLNSKNEGAYSSLFPAKFADEQQRSPFMSMGYATGRALGDFGGRVEPMLKITSYEKLDDPDYKKSEWYKKMNEESKKIVDQAFRKKMEQAEK